PYESSKTQSCSKHFERIEIELRVERALDVACLAEAVLLAGKQEIADRDLVAAQGIDHALGLIGRHDPVLVALKEDDRALEAFGVFGGGTLLVARGFRRIGADQPVQIARFELVGIARERGSVAHAEMAAAAGEIIAEGERRERGVTARAAAGDDAATRIDQVLPGEEFRTVDRIVDVDNAPRQMKPVAIFAAVAAPPAVV